MPTTFTMEDLRQKLQERQHKMTPQRQIVLQIFLDHPLLLPKILETPAEFHLVKIHILSFPTL